MKCTRGFSTLLELFVIAIVIAGGVYVYLHKTAHDSSSNLQTASSTAQIVSSSGTYEIRTKVLGLSTTSLPYITSYGDVNVMKGINADIQKLFDYSSCVNQDDLRNELKSKGYSEKEIKSMSISKMMDTLNWYSDTEVINSIFFSQGIFSFAYSYGSDCGGAHPNAGTSAITFDLLTGKEVEFADLFGDYQRQKKEIIGILHTYYVIEDHNESYGSAQPYDSQCADVASEYESLVWDYASYYISKDGLKVIPSYSHAESPCEIEVPVPINELKPYLSKSSLLLRI